MDYKIQTIARYSPDDRPLYKAAAELTAPIKQTYPGQETWLHENFSPDLKTAAEK